MKYFLTRSLFLLGVAIIETTAPALLMTLLGVPGAWGALLVIALLAGGADWLAGRVVPVAWQRPVLAALALVSGLGAARVALPHDDILAALFTRQSPHNGMAYLAVLCGLYTAWRGITIHTAERQGVRTLFARGMAITLLALIVGSAFGSRDPALLAVATTELLVVVAAGLTAAAVLHAHQEVTERTRPGGSLAPTIAAILVVVGGSLLVLSLLGEEARRALVLVADLLIWALTLLLIPLVMALMPLVEWILRSLHAQEAMAALQDWARGLQTTDEPIEFLAEIQRLFPWLGPALEWLGRLMPVIVLLALVWLVAQRRIARRERQDEERVSLFSWELLASDLRDLLGKLRRRKPVSGLRSVLDRLSGASPDERIRRAYVQVLLLLEARGIVRPEPLTPREFVSHARLDTQEATFQQLTSNYELARYAPGTATEAIAQQAEQAHIDLR